MDEIKENQAINPNDLPENQVFERKEIYQYKQPAGTDKPLEDIEEERKNPVNKTDVPEEDKTSKEEGLNEARSAGNAGAFEGFEDQGEA